MLAKVNKAFVRMGQIGLYARQEYGDNAAAAAPSILGKALRLSRQGSAYMGVVVYSVEDKEEFNRTGNLKIHFAPLTPDGTKAEEVVRLGREVGIAVSHCLQLEGLEIEWNGNPDESILVTGESKEAM